MSDPGHVHFIAIGGTGMGSLAGLLRSRGIRVTGSDEEIYPPMSTALESWGIPVSRGFRAENLTGPAGERPDWVIVGNAVRADNPEARAALEGNFEVRSFPDALYELALSRKHPVVVSGTHGKTTTTSLIASLLERCGRDPSILVGGISVDIGGSYREGAGEHFVVEGDEYDTAFFDKTPKFLHYHPRTLVITSIEFDHADIYRDLAHVRSAFESLVQGLPLDAVIIACFDDPNVREVVGAASCRVVSYGISKSRRVDWQARDPRATSTGTAFELDGPGGREAVRIPLHGDFNVANAVAALATGIELGVPIADAIQALTCFRGVKRRQELRYEIAGIAVFDDFAHHPTAVRGSIDALRSRFPGRRIVAVFEPRTNTSRRRVFQSAYAEALSDADEVLVQRVESTPIYSATGEVTEFFSADELVLDLEGQGGGASAHDNVGAIVSELVRTVRPDDVVLVMSNGAFGDIWGKLREALEK